MFKVFIYIFVTLVCSVSTDAKTTFDLYQASQLAQAVTSNLNKINPIVSQPFKSCNNVSSPSGEVVAECSIKDEDYKYPIVKIDYDSTQSLPPELKSSLSDKFIKENEGQKISCVFRFKMINDNLQLPGQKRDTNQDPIGDDRGYTHGSEVGVSCLSVDGQSTAFSYSTDLYTEPDFNSKQWQKNGHLGLKQKFTAENIFSLVQDNINQGRATYWKRGVGFINLSQKRKWGLLQADGQQQWYHDVMNRVNKGSAYEYTNIEGTLDHWAGFVTLAIGLQENRKLGQNCSIHLNADAGVRIATRAQSSMINANLGTQFNYQMTDNYFAYLKAQSEIKVRKSSQVLENTIAAGVRSRQGGYVEAGVMSQKGNRQDVPDLPSLYNNNKNDLMYFMRLGKSI